MASSTHSGSEGKARPSVGPREKQDENNDAERRGAAAVLADPKILERVLGFLPKPADVRCCAGVNKTFRDVCKAATLWKARVALLPTVVLSGATPAYRKLLLKRTKMCMGKLLVRTVREACMIRVAPYIQPRSEHLCASLESGVHSLAICHWSHIVLPAVFFPSQKYELLVLSTSQTPRYTYSINQAHNYLVVSSCPH